MPRLQILVGPDRHHLVPAAVNDSCRPTEIDTDRFVGRVLVRIRDFEKHEENKGKENGGYESAEEYFKDRSRRFHIQIEGRFKQEWTGDDILFGTDFDRWVDFPRAPFNAGMRVAKFIDPCTFYEEHPKSGRPFIMSPYIACMTTFCAWPAPSRADDAVVVLRHTSRDDTSLALPRNNASSLASDEDQLNTAAAAAHLDGVGSPEVSSEEDEFVPTEELDDSQELSPSVQKKKKSWFGGFSVGSGEKKGKGKEEGRRIRRYWRFVGFRGDPRVEIFLKAHNASLPASPTSTPPSESVSAVVTDSAEATKSSGQSSLRPTLARLGTMERAKRNAGRSSAFDLRNFHESLPDGSNATQADAGKDGGKLALKVDTAASTPADNTATSNGAASSASSSPASATPTSSVTSPKRKTFPSLDASIARSIEEAAHRDGLNGNDIRVAGQLLHHHHHHHHHHRTGSIQTSRSSSRSRRKQTSDKEDVEISTKLDDQLGPWRFADQGTDMIEDNAFIFTTTSQPVEKRRKHFSNQKNRKEFVYDPDVVYAASFFSPFMDFNTFDLTIGPVHINVARFFREMPVRYTLRAAHDEECTFVTVEFRLVDD